MSDELKDFEFDVTQPLPEEYQNPPGKYRWLKNGVIYDVERSRYVSNKYSVTKVTAPGRRHAMQLAREEKRLAAQAAAAGGIAKALMGDGALLMEAWAKVVGKQAELAIDIEKGRSSTGAAEFIGRAAGLLSEREKGGGEADSQAAHIGAAFIEGLARRIGGFDADLDDDGPVIIDGEFNEQSPG